ncbi:flagellar basal-body MS-ring/collar protein FliF [Sphingopyxis macrogoltabida]|uniref:Flagellar M-ring protein n=1 Tax=Sphingopyxis macrogoltabida TaxID=33050 RepID=A0A0N9UAN4_SPHMC|nr:flagellar basal-body MS-ring/collar protein FliF [Sphingopyxis macrogoltabida]ALH82450.1 flagellar M-ring protein FliF [Sphingopyxis macrogoltabida]
MADAQTLTPIDSAQANRLPVPAFGNRFAPIQQFVRQPAVQRALPAIATTTAIGLAALAYFTMQSAPQAQLFAGLADADKSAVADALQTAGIAHSIDPVTGALTVDADKMHAARIALAGQGLPKAAPDGDNLIASLPMGASRAIEGETLRAAREADLARTIEAIDAVKSARIHIAAAEPSLFVREDKPATASVMLTLQNGRSLSDGQVQAIRFLVASSVPGMNADQVSVIDQRGALLSDSATSSDMKAFQLQTQIEDRFRRALDSLLGPMLGNGNYTVEVHADVDMSESQATRESFPKDDRALRSEQITRQVSGQGPAPAVGIPGALSNQPPQATTVTGEAPVAAPATAGAPETQSNENAARAYEVGREISVTHQPQGQLRRVSVAVALNQGKKALTQADMAKIDGLVKGAVGFDATRGDQVAISQRPFVKVEDESPAFYDQGWFLPLVKQIGAIVAALLAFFFIGRPLIRAAKERAAARAEQSASLEASLLAATDGQPALPGGGSNRREITLEMIEQAPSYEARANLVRAFVRQDSARAALVVRQLMQEGARG